MKKSESTLLYMQLYDQYKDMILNGLLQPGTRLPSVRRCAESRQVSRTTVEQAYMLLAADGYIVSKPQSGFFVTEMWSAHTKHPSQNESLPPSPQPLPFGKASLISERGKADAKARIWADYSDTSSGQESFDVDRWRRYVKSALRQGERLLSYGEGQGEEDLREVLCDYLRNTRNVVCTPDRIVIGAGFQSLLHILCPLYTESKSVYLSDTGFAKGQAVFEDHGFTINDHPVPGGLWYVSPSHMNRMCQVMEIKDRFSLLAKAKAADAYIIEDDYDCEFINSSHPVPSIQGLDGGNRVIYLGTFSRVLLPSIRISFMILPPELLARYERRKKLYNQTVSKVDQIALCQYIRDGHLSFQIRKTRKSYEEESQKLAAEVEDLFAKVRQAIVSIKRSGQVLRIKVREGFDVFALRERLAEKGVLIGLPYEEGLVDSYYLAGSLVRGEARTASLQVIAEEMLQLM